MTPLDRKTEIAFHTLQPPHLHGLAINRDFRHLMREILFLSLILTDDPDLETQAGIIVTSLKNRRN